MTDQLQPVRCRVWFSLERPNDTLMLYVIPEGTIVKIDGIPCRLYHKIKVETSTRLLYHEDKMLAVRVATKFALLVIVAAATLGFALWRIG